MTDNILFQIKEQLVDQWVAAHFRAGLMENAARKVTMKAYSTHDQYRFEQFIKSNKWTSEEFFQDQIPDSASYYEYGYDAWRVPLLVKQYFNRKLTRIGIFTWEENAWEYLEYNFGSSICASYAALLLTNGLKDQFMSLKLNGGGLYFDISDLTAEEIRAKLLAQPNNYFMQVERYNYENGRVVTADALSHMPGIDTFLSTHHYEYTDDGSLHRIICQFENGDRQVQYISTDGISIEAVLPKLAERMAELVITTIADSGYREKLGCIQLSYHYCGSYWPYISTVTAVEMEDAMEDNLQSFPFGDIYQFMDPIQLNASEELLDLYAMMDQAMTEQDDFDIGIKMLVETARVLNENRLNNILPLTEDFIVFPIDWSIDIDGPGEQLLRKCGAGNDQIEKWKKLNWLKDSY